MKNKLVSIGFIGSKKCYLNITEEQAIERYCKRKNITLQMFDEENISVFVIEFEDEFSAYEVWE